MIGDSENDALLARAAAMALILMRYGYARIDPAQLGADRVLHRFDELPAALEALGLAPIHAASSYASSGLAARRRLVQLHSQ